MEKVLYVVNVNILKNQLEIRMEDWIVFIIIKRYCNGL